MHSVNTIARRDLIRGAAALVGGSALGLLPSLAEAALAPSAPKLALGFWNGDRFVPAASLPAGDAHERVRLTAVGLGGVDAIEAHAPSEGDRHPFVFWVAPPGGMARSRATLATEPNGDLVLAAFAKGERHEIRLVAGQASGPKLRAGTYVLTSGSLSALHRDEAGKVVARRDAPHVVLTVEPA